ncbi:MAG: LON peptidase substrate-binding domain-containing protein, partial [Desulfobacteraceae bacterium]|nr:LON peptidase substrate-binding domain-containing protein [Desulfobacteraceae bacterium]
MINISKFFNQDGSDPETKELPMVPLKDVVLFPNMTTALFIGREKSVNALSRAMGTDKVIFFATQNLPDIKKPTEKDIHKTGTEAKILQLLRLPDGSIKTLVQGIARGRISQIMEKDDLLVAEITSIDNQFMDENRAEAAVRTVAEAFEKYAGLSGLFSKEILQGIRQEYSDPSKYSDLLAAKMPFKIEDKQQLLDIYDIEERLFFLLQLIQKETDVFSMSQKI